jgi:hypothetical protein
MWSYHAPPQNKSHGLVASVNPHWAILYAGALHGGASVSFSLVFLGALFWIPYLFFLT